MRGRAREGNDVRFAFVGHDRRDAGELRARLRPAHAEYHRGRANPVGGPLLDEGGRACGTLIVLEAADLDEARRVVAADPFVTGGLFESTVLHELRAVDWPTAD